MLFDLYRKTLDVLESGQNSNDEKHEMGILEQVKSRASSRYVDLKEDEIEKHLQLMPKRYVEQTDIATILNHIELRNKMNFRKELFSIEVIHKRSENISKVSLGFRDYMVQILDYLTYHSGEKPFPFSEFPKSQDTNESE